MASGYAARRLALLAAAQRAGGDLVRFDPAHLRCSLGTSIADVRIPVQVTPDAAAIVGGAAAELTMLLVSQHRAFVPRDDVDRVILADVALERLVSPARRAVSRRTGAEAEGGADAPAALLQQFAAA